MTDVFTPATPIDPQRAGDDYLISRVRYYQSRPKPNLAEYRVYFIGAGDFVKIGLAKDVGDRIAQMQVHCPLTLVLLASVPGHRAKERTLHKRYAEYHHRGEWFHLRGRLARYVADLQRSARMPK